ncbi:MAG: hypothetical protein C4346_04890 [Chloroflexota bacterium]
MRALVRLRWPLLLALAGALLAPGLSRDFMIFLICMVAAERLARYLGRRACWARTSTQWREAATAPETPRTAGPARVQRGAPIALIQVLDAACSSCQGHGCEACAYTGLA